MPKLRTVEAWPSTRHPDRPWHTDGDLAAFLGASRGVFDLYSDELPAAEQTALTSSIRFMPVEDAKSAAGFDVDLFRTAFEGFDMVRVRVPQGFASLAPDDRVLAALDLIHGTVCGLGELRGWDRDSLGEVRARVVARGVRFTWACGWKASPGRRHHARAVYWLDDDGHGHVQLETKPRGVPDTVTARSEPALAFMTAEGFKRSAATLTWTDASTVTVAPWAGLFGDDASHLHLDAAGHLTPLGLPAPVTASATTPVTTRVISGDEWLDDPDAAWIALEECYQGAYGSEMLRVAQLLAKDRDFTAWWAEAPFRLLRVRSVELDPSWPEYAPKPGARKSGQDLVLTVVVAKGDLPPRRDVDGRKERARVDLHAALVVLAGARRLPVPPQLPEHIRERP